MGGAPDRKVGFDRAAAWLPVIIGALLVAIVAVFIFTAPNQIVTPKESGYLIASAPENMDRTAVQ